MSEQESLEGMPDVPDATPAADADMLPKDGPKPRTRRTRGAAKPRAAAAPRRAQRVDIKGGMANIYVMAAGAVAMVPSPVVFEGGPTRTQAIGQAILENAEKIGGSWEQLAKENADVRAALERFLSVSAVGVLISAHVPILLVAATAYGFVPPQIAAMMSAAVATPDAQA